MSSAAKSISKSGIQTSTDGSSYIPSSTRADGTTRKEIRVRPGYRPPEDVETYKNRSAEAWKTRGSNGVPGAESTEKSSEPGEVKNKNAKRREAARRKQDSEADAQKTNESLNFAMDQTRISEQSETKSEPGTTAKELNEEAEVERQKRIRNQLKKLRAVRDLKDKRVNGEKLSHDQLLKIGKEDELLRDLKKLNYDGPEITRSSEIAGG